MLEKENITGIILAGGQSSRMCRDKGMLDLNVKAFIQYSIEALIPLVSKIIIISDNPDYDDFDAERIKDLIKNSGPLAGIYTGLNASKTEYNLILSCDIPLVQSKALKSLIEEQLCEARAISEGALGDTCLGSKELSKSLDFPRRMLQ